MGSPRRMLLSNKLEQLGLEAIAEVVSMLPGLGSQKISKAGFLHIAKRQLKDVGHPDEIVETNIPKLVGFRPLGMAVSRPRDGHVTQLKVEKLNPTEPFRRFVDVRVTYRIRRKGGPSETRTTYYMKESSENLETVERLAQHFALKANRKGTAEPRDIEAFNQLSQWEDAYLEFKDYHAYADQLRVLEQRLGEFGSVLRRIILFHGEMAYHLGLRVREAELGYQQDRAAAIVRGGKSGGETRALKERRVSNAWQDAFVLWLSAEISRGSVETWWRKRRGRGQVRNSIETLTRYSRESWPSQGFRVGDAAEKLGQLAAPLPRTLRKIISRHRSRLAPKGVKGTS